MFHLLRLIDNIRELRRESKSKPIAQAPQTPQIPLTEKEKRNLDFETLGKLIGVMEQSLKTIDDIFIEYGKIIDGMSPSDQKRAYKTLVMVSNFLTRWSLDFRESIRLKSQSQVDYIK